MLAPFLNLTTLLLIQVALTILTTLLLVAAALSSEAQPEQRLWAWGNVVACFGFVVGRVTTLPNAIHGGLSYALMGLGLALVLRGLRLFCGQTLPWRAVAGIAVLAFLFPAYFATVQPDLVARLIASGFFLGLVNLACAWTLIRGLQGSIRPMMWISAAGFGVLGLALVLRSAYQLAAYAGWHDAISTDELMGVTLLLVALGQVTIAFGLILMIAHRNGEKLNRLTLLDPLTGVMNRMGMERMGQRLLLRAAQSHRSVSIAMVDADHFKIINDTYGHPAGDQVLIHLAQLLMAQVRPGDLVVRYGGEEFILILEGSNVEDACRVANRLRELIAKARVHTNVGEIEYKVSIGVSCSEKGGYDLKQLIELADSALYSAKQGGRNRVCMA